MNSIISWHTNPNQAIEKSIQILQKGGIVVYPTDTLYGLGTDATNEEAIDRLYLLKRKPRKHPMSVMVHSISDIKKFVPDFSPSLEEFLHLIMPGAVTTILKVHGGISRKIVSLHNTLGFRVPDHSFCKELTRIYSNPIISTSANISGKEPPVNVREVLGYFPRGINLIIDSGPIYNKLPSTVIDLSCTPPKILREGSISSELIRRLLSKYEKTHRNI
jgi:L-threonylcarbamoyladenylate synthase